jgi:predicted TIM-barrel fold metal-dependent hydrolase
LSFRPVPVIPEKVYTVLRDMAPPLLSAGYGATARRIDKVRRHCLDQPPPSTVPVSGFVQRGKATHRADHRAMDKVGVDGAIFVSPFSMYRYDASYAVEVQKAHPGRFALVKPVDPDDPAVADVIADWKKTPGTVGIRIFMTKETNRAPGDPGLERICRAAVKHNFPINLIFSGNLDAGTALIDRYPDTRFVIDHMALQQPSVPPAARTISRGISARWRCPRSPLA